jgi:membrane-bound serine protease (ClpP class)
MNITKRFLAFFAARHSRTGFSWRAIGSVFALVGGSIVAVGACVIFLHPAVAAAEDQRTNPLVLELRIDGQVEPILATYVEEGLAEAARRQTSLVLITMDTPGGLSDSMKDIIQHILASPVPVAVYVYPTGARAASAGFYILLSADIAAMAPGTHTGAASPIIAIGGFPQQIDEAFRKKINNDAMAFLRSFTEKRGRNPTLAESAVTEAKAFTADEALNGKLIDLIANSPEDLLRQLDGRPITRFDGTRVTLAVGKAVRMPFELSGRQKFLARIVEPDMFFVLLILGVLGLYTEFTHPGVIAPGVVGGICLVLALYAMHFLPVNLAGLLLILLALAFFILEAKYTSHGVLVAGGIVSMLLGAMFLIRSPLTGGGVSLGVAVAVTLPFAILTVVLMRLVLRSRKWKPATGKEELIGSQGIAISGLTAGVEGMVRVHGELWQAVSPQAAPAGGAVRVVGMEGLKLHVEPVRGEPLQAARESSN